MGFSIDTDFVYGDGFDPAKMRYVGKPSPMVDGPQRVLGTIQWSENVRLDNTLVGKFLRSPHPHAKIKSMDISKAEKVPGVKAILTPFNIEKVYPYKKKFTVARHLDRWVMSEKARFMGDEVAAVAAVDDDAAEEALSLIDVEYEVLPFYTTTEEALAPGAELIHEQKTNVVGELVAKSAPGKLEYGDVDAGFKEADFVFEGTYRSSPQQQDLIEPRCCTAVWNGDVVEVYTTLQATFRLRTELSSKAQLGIKQNKLLIHSPFTGAGMGNSKSGNYVGAAIILAKMAGQPVRIKLDRLAELSATYCRVEWVFKIKTGHKSDGTLTSYLGESVGNSGAYNDLGISNFIELQTIPNVKATAQLVYTNIIPAGNYRGVTSPQIIYATNTHMFQAAVALGLDPLDFFRRTIERKFMDQSKKGGEIEPERYPVDEVIDKCVAMHGYQWHKPGEKRLADGRMHGIGVGVCNYGAAGGRASGAIVEIADDGTVVLISGASDIGQGVKTTMAQVCAECLGCKYEDVYVHTGESLVCPWDGGASGSRTGVDSSFSVARAALDAKKKLLYEASLQMKVSPEELDTDQSMVFVKSDPTKTLSFAKVLSSIQGYMYNIKPCVGYGERPLKPAGTEYAGLLMAICEVAVDTDTGEVEVLKHTAVYDVGFALNPIIVLGQMNGGGICGISWCMNEDMLFDKGTGLPLSTTHEKFGIMGPLDFVEINSGIVEARDPKLPFGARGFGEGSMMPHTGAVGNAIYDAIGVPINAMPFTPDHILEALGKG